MGKNRARSKHLHASRSAKRRKAGNHGEAIASDAATQAAVFVVDGEENEKNELQAQRDKYVAGSDVDADGWTM